MSLPEVKEFRGKDGDSHSIMDYIARIEKNADYEYPDGNEEGKRESQIFYCLKSLIWKFSGRNSSISLNKV